MGKEQANWEITLKNILYYIEDENEQQKVIDILIKYEKKIEDNRIKNSFQKIFYKSKKDYYSKVDFLIKDILDGKWDFNTKQILADMLLELKPNVEKAEKTFWDRLISIFKGS